MPARRKSPRRSKSRSKSPRRVLKRRSSGTARTSVTRRRSPKRTYKGTDTRLYGAERVDEDNVMTAFNQTHHSQESTMIELAKRQAVVDASRLRQQSCQTHASALILAHLRTGPIGVLITQLEKKLTTNDNSELQPGADVEIAPVDNVPPLTGTVVSQMGDLVTVKVSETEEKQYLRQFLQKIDTHTPVVEHSV